MLSQQKERMQSMRCCWQTLEKNCIPDAVYSYDLPVEKHQISRGSEVDKAPLENAGIPQLTQSAAQDGAGKPTRTSNPIRDSSVATIRSIDGLLHKVEDLSRSVPSIDALISTEDANISTVLKEAVGLDACVLNSLQSAVSRLRKGFADYGTKQDLFFNLFDKKTEEGARHSWSISAAQRACFSWCRSWTKRIRC